MVGTLVGTSQKLEGIEWSRLAARAFVRLRQAPLKPSEVTLDSLDFAIAKAFVRLHPDNPHNLHPSGVENKNMPCLSFHMINN